MAKHKQGEKGTQNENKLYKVACEPDCGFLVQSHDEEETVSIAKEHARTMHDMKNVSDSEIREHLSTG